jgi:molecular chaperone GrpE (heat shock protein)
MSLKNNHFKQEQQYVIERIAELREELKDLVDYLDLLEARAQNFRKRRYNSEQVEKMLALK